MKTFLFSLILFSYQLKAQVLKLHEGVVVLATKEVLTGTISIEPRQDLILFMSGNTFAVYPAHKVKSLYFFDKEANINRRFVSLRAGPTIVNTTQLFEVVLQGSVSVLRRQTSRSLRPSDSEDFVYYCRYDNILMPLHKFNRRVYPALVASTGSRLAKYVSEQHLKTWDASNIIRVVEYYNHMVVVDEAIARY